jgi:hypothetical protein
MEKTIMHKWVENIQLVSPISNLNLDKAYSKFKLDISFYLRIKRV